MSKVSDVIDAMRAACGTKERFTAGWIELSHTHKSLADALQVVFRRKPTAQRLGLWLSENVGVQSGEFVLYGRHSASAKAWRYAVLKPSEREEIVRAAQAKKAAKSDDRLGVGPAFVLPVQSVTDGMMNPHMDAPPAAPERPYVATVDRTTGTITRTVLLPDPAQPLPVPQTNLPDSMLPIWTQEGRRPTGAELAAAHRAINGNGNVLTGAGNVEAFRDLERRGNGAGEHVAGNGVRGGSTASTYWNRSLRDL